MCTFRRVHVRIVILLVVLVVVVLVVSMRRCRSALKKRGASPLCWAQNGPGRPGERHVAEVEDGVRSMTEFAFDAVFPLVTAVSAYVIGRPLRVLARGPQAFPISL